MSRPNSAEVVVVSGGSRGLGLALIKSLLGPRRIVATFSRSQGAELGRLGRRHGRGLEWRAVDAADPAALQAFVLDLARRHGRIDALVNNAAVGTYGVFAMARPTDVRAMVDINLVSTMTLTQACVRQMLRRRRGAIVNVGSIAGLRGASGSVVYGATKAAIEGLTRHLARELGPHGIRVNSVAPGYFDSEMSSSLSPAQLQRIARRTPLGRLASAADIVPPIRFFLSEEAAFVTGQTLLVDGGLSA